MKNYCRIGVVLLVAATAVSCSTVTVKGKDTSKASLKSEPTYEVSKPYFLWGLVGEHHFDIHQICNGKGAEQIQTEFTVLDSALSIITLGIYNPRTAKIWCTR